MCVASTVATSVCVGLLESTCAGEWEGLVRQKSRERIFDQPHPHCTSSTKFSVIRDKMASKEEVAQLKKVVQELRKGQLDILIRLEVFFICL